MSELRQWLGLMEAAGDPMRSEILRLFDRLPARWRAEDGSEAWKNLRFAAWLAAQPDESLAATLVSFQTTLAYLAANPKAKLSDPLKRRVPRAKVATLTTLLSRAGAPFQNWLLNLLKDDPADLQHALGDPPTKREYLDDLPIRLAHPNTLVCRGVSESRRRDVLLADGQKRFVGQLANGPPVP